jgi:hypothetical protein
MMKLNPSTVALISARQLINEACICENGDYPIDISKEGKVYSSNLNPCMKLGEFILFLKETRIISSECSVYEVLKNYGELKGSNDFKLKVRQNILAEKIRITRKGLKENSNEDLFDMNKKDGIGSRKIDALKRKRTYTEGNIYQESGSLHNKFNSIDEVNNT